QIRRPDPLARLPVRIVVAFPLQEGGDAAAHHDVADEQQPDRRFRRAFRAAARAARAAWFSGEARTFPRTGPRSGRARSAFAAARLQRAVPGAAAGRIRGVRGTRAFRAIRGFTRTSRAASRSGPGFADASRSISRSSRDAARAN